MIRRCRTCGTVFEPVKDYYYLCLRCYEQEAAALRSRRPGHVSVPELLRRVADLEAENARLRVAERATLDDGLLRRIMQLVHPDRHNGSELAHRVAQEVNELRARQREAIAA